MLLAGLLAIIGFAATAQTATPPAAGPAPRGHMMGHMDPARMQAFIAKRQAALKEKLKLSAAQEGAWTAYTAAMQPPANMTRPNRAEFEKLSTPERIDKMRALRAQHSAEMDKRAEATKTFYAALTPEQQKVFDANAMRRGGHGEHRGMHGGPANRG
jgi:Spy/CpxP family protein refolding chaperone